MSEPDVSAVTELMRFELVDAVRMGIDYRYPISSARLCGRMAK
jgi:hypothetical protein